MNRRTLLRGAGRSGKGGFTLIEALISAVIIFIVISLVYTTFFSVNSITATVQRRMAASEVIFNFFNSLHDELKSVIREEEALFERDELVFSYKPPGALYPANVRYFIVESEQDGHTLFRRQENILSGYTFTMPVLRGCDNIEFSYYDGETWTGEPVWEETGVWKVALDIDFRGSRFFYPVFIGYNHD